MSRRTKDGVDAARSSNPPADPVEQEAISQLARAEASYGREEIRQLVHDLRVHQVELQMQNEELRRVQVALDASRSRYFELYDLAPLGYVTLSDAGLIIEANLRAHTMLGREVGALVGQALSRHVAKDDQDAYFIYRKKLGTSPKSEVCELRMRRGADAEFWSRLEAVGVQDEESDTTVYRVMISDITESRTLQDSLARADQMARMGILAAGVGHEINNPLTYVLSNLEVLSERLPRLAGGVLRCRDALRAEIGEDAMAAISGEADALMTPSALEALTTCAQRAEGGAKRIGDIAKGLGFFAREEPNTLVPVDLNEAAERALDMALNEIKCRARIVEAWGRVPRIRAAEGKLTQVVLNLLINAAHAIEEGAVDANRVSVRTWAAEGHVHLEVTDTGCGISPGDLETIFEPFYTTKASQGGTGLGLAITRQIVGDFGGEIRVDSTVGEGTRFLIRFPMARHEPVASAPITTDLPSPRGRILVVDDESYVRTAIVAMLRSQHEVVSAGDGREAQTILEEDTAFDVILSDLMMPGVSGADLHQWLIAHDPDLAERLIFVTGGAYTPRTQDYLRSVTNLCISKPLDTKQLRKVVGARVAAARSEATD